MVVAMVLALAEAKEVFAGESSDISVSQYAYRDHGVAHEPRAARVSAIHSTASPRRASGGGVRPRRPAPRRRVARRRLARRAAAPRPL